MTYDAIVVGARCGGAPFAMLLARRGHRVLLVDRAARLTDPVSTHYLPHAGVRRLADWGLLDALRASGVPPIGPMTVSWQDSVIRGAVEAVDGIDCAYAPRRTVLDALLVEAAAAAGAEVRLGYAGKSKGGKTRKGSKWPRLYLHEAARAASGTKGTYLSAQYSRIKAHRGPAKARVAVEHSILVALFHMLDRDEPYHDLGADYFTHRRDPARHAQRLAAQLDALGYDTVITRRPDNQATAA